MSTVLSDLWTEAEAAENLRMGERTLRDLRKRGLIRYVAITKRKIMYRPEDCDAYIQSRLRLDEATAVGPHRAPSATPRGKGNIVPFSRRRR